MLSTNFSGPEDWSRKADETVQSRGAVGLYTYTLEKHWLTLKLALQREESRLKPNQKTPNPTPLTNKPTRPKRRVTEEQQPNPLDPCC